MFYLRMRVSQVLPCLPCNPSLDTEHRSTHLEVSLGLKIKGVQLKPVWAALLSRSRHFSAWKGVNTRCPRKKDELYVNSWKPVWFLLPKASFQLAVSLQSCPATTKWNKAPAFQTGTVASSAWKVWLHEQGVWMLCFSKRSRKAVETSRKMKG